MLGFLLPSSSWLLKLSIIANITTRHAITYTYNAARYLRRRFVIIFIYMRVSKLINIISINELQDCHANTVSSLPIIPVLMIMMMMMMMMMMIIIIIIIIIITITIAIAITITITITIVIAIASAIAIIIIIIIIVNIIIIIIVLYIIVHAHEQYC